jgi:oligopeptide transport system substrate-binding protein
VEELDDQSQWETTEMVGNGPFMLSAPVGAEGASLVRNPEWNGTCYDQALGLPEQPAIETLRFGVSDDGYAAFEAGDGHVARAPSGSENLQQAAESHESTFDGPLMSMYYFAVNWEDPVVGGQDNALLRQAIAQSVDRETVNDDAYGGTSTPATGVTPPVIPGFQSELCDHCSFDPDAARAAFEEWEGEGNSLDEPITIQSPAGVGNNDVVVAQLVEDLEAVGIPAVEEPFDPGTYFTELRDEGACRQICVVTGFASYLSYDTFMYDGFHTDAIGEGNYGRFSDETFDDLVYEARGTVDADRQAELYREAEQRLLNEAIAAIPVLWSSRPYVYGDDVESLPLNGLGLVVWERVAFST